MRTEALTAHLTELVSDAETQRAARAATTVENPELQPNSQRMSQTATILKNNKGSLRRVMSSKSRGLWEGYGIKNTNKKKNGGDDTSRHPDGMGLSDSVNILERNKLTSKSGLSQPYFYRPSGRTGAYGLKQAQGTKHYQSYQEISKAKFDVRFQ